MSCPITSFWKLKRAGYSQGTVTFSEHSKLKMLYWISIAFTLFLGLSRGFGKWFLFVVIDCLCFFQCYSEGAKSNANFWSLDLFKIQLQKDTELLIYC